MVLFCGVEKMIEVKFENVGRDKMKWFANLPSVTPDYIRQSIKQHQALASNPADIFIDGNEHSGRLLVGFGPGRCVGKYTIVK